MSVTNGYCTLAELKAALRVSIPDLRKLVLSALSTAKRVAMLSYSTGESGSGEDVDKVREATELVRSTDSSLDVEGPIQYDAAVDASVAKTKLPRIEDAVKAGGFLAGTPTEIIAELKKVEQRYPGLDRISCSMALGTPLDVALHQLERFAKEVMPAFR